MKPLVESAWNSALDTTICDEALSIFLNFCFQFQLAPLYLGESGVSITWSVGQERTNGRAAMAGSARCCPPRLSSTPDTRFKPCFPESRGIP